MNSTHIGIGTTIPCRLTGTEAAAFTRRSSHFLSE